MSDYVVYCSPARCRSGYKSCPGYLAHNAKDTAEALARACQRCPYLTPYSYERIEKL